MSKFCERSCELYVYMFLAVPTANGTAIWILADEEFFLLIFYDAFPITERAFIQS